ncbi:hypothetical protein HDV04_002074 [Boothiomyces sp. JEL0838]|nr:hypothetical protein HDV04_002074 [Boothiomyces sp. JEL0838]
MSAVNALNQILSTRSPRTVFEKLENESKETLARPMPIFVSKCNGCQFNFKQTNVTQFSSVETTKSKFEFGKIVSSIEFIKCNEISISLSDGESGGTITLDNCNDVSVEFKIKPDGWMIYTSRNLKLKIFYGDTEYKIPQITWPEGRVEMGLKTVYKDGKFDTFLSDSFGNKVQAPQ